MLSYFHEVSSCSSVLPAVTLTQLIHLLHWAPSQNCHYSMWTHAFLLYQLRMYQLRKFDVSRIFNGVLQTFWGCTCKSDTLPEENVASLRIVFTQGDMLNVTRHLYCRGERVNLLTGNTQLLETRIKTQQFCTNRCSLHTGLFLNNSWSTLSTL